jgi:hypothetical protein
VALWHLHVDLVVEVFQQFQIVDDAQALVEPDERGEIHCFERRQLARFHPRFVVVVVLAF